MVFIRISWWFRSEYSGGFFYHNWWFQQLRFHFCTKHRLEPGAFFATCQVSLAPTSKASLVLKLKTSLVLKFESYFSQVFFTSTVHCLEYDLDILVFWVLTGLKTPHNGLIKPKNSVKISFFLYIVSRIQNIGPVWSLPCVGAELRPPVSCRLILGGARVTGGERLWDDGGISLGFGWSWTHAPPGRRVRCSFHP